MWRLAFWWRGWRYHWQRARRVVEEAPYGFVPAADFYGSMDLDAERAQIRRAQQSTWLGGLPAFAPEPTDAEVAASRAAHGYIPELDAEQQEVMPDETAAPTELQVRDMSDSTPVSPGPGGQPSLGFVPPGPAIEISHEECEAAKALMIQRWGAVPPSLQRVLDAGGRVGLPKPRRESWAEAAAARLADDLGPNAARVLARYERRFQERWGCRLAAAA